MIMVLIFIMSAKDGTESGNLSEWLLNTSFGKHLMHFLPRLTESGQELDIRKYAHIAEYALLSVSSGIFLRELMLEIIPARSAAACMGFCFLYACSDELHQVFVPGRVGAFTDVLIDMTGAVFGVMMVCLFCILRKELK